MSRAELKLIRQLVHRLVDLLEELERGPEQAGGPIPEVGIRTRPDGSSRVRLDCYDIELTRAETLMLNQLLDGAFHAEEDLMRLSGVPNLSQAAWRNRKSRFVRKITAGFPSGVESLRGHGLRLDLAPGCRIRRIGPGLCHDIARTSPRRDPD